jgi:hypothetical protein
MVKVIAAHEQRSTLSALALVLAFAGQQLARYKNNVQHIPALGKY